MEIQYVICDIDGTLLPPDQGFVIQPEVEEALIQLQKEGKVVILASARIFQGVLPIALQAKMDEYGGYILSSNGAYGYDVKRQKMLFCHEILKEDALAIQARFLQAGLDFAIAQPEYMVASGFSRGFQLDHDNCDVDYYITHHPKTFVEKEISKCSASGTKETIDVLFDGLKQEIEAAYPYAVVRSTPYFIDVISKKSNKANGLAQLFTYINGSFANAAAIGDGDSDAEMISRCALGATLENGSESCHQVADMIVPSCTQNGCLQFFAALSSKK